MSPAWMCALLVLPHAEQRVEVFIPASGRLEVEECLP